MPLETFLCFLAIKKNGLDVWVFAKKFFEIIYYYALFNDRRIKTAFSGAVLHDVPERYFIFEQ